MKIATCIKNRLDGFAGDARLYRLSHPLEKFRYVVVSGAFVPFSGEETYIFGATKAGAVESYAELAGSFQGSIDHAQALLNAGYRVKEASND